MHGPYSGYSSSVNFSLTYRPVSAFPWGPFHLVGPRQLLCSLDSVWHCFFFCLWSGCNVAVWLTEMFRWLLVAGRHRLTDSQWVRDGQSGSQWPGLRWWLCRHLPLPGNKELFCPDSPFQVEEENICPHVVICSPWWWLNVLYHLNQQFYSHMLVAVQVRSCDV